MKGEHGTEAQGILTKRNKGEVGMKESVQKQEDTQSFLEASDER